MLDDEEQFQKELDEINEMVFERVYPILDEIEEEYPNHSAFYVNFICTMHEVFAQGWTKEELIAEIEEHHEIFLKNMAEQPGPELH